MRPIRLQLSGFAAFREPTTIDFEGAEFFALVGPTGSGKSTVIDAMCFALYGQVPRYDDARRVGFAVTTGTQEARVSLTFEADSVSYVATRVIRKRPDGGASTREARLERLDDEVVLAGSAREMDPAVQNVVGLSFDHFTKCVVLPQGEFARFLRDEPSKRQDLLVRLLDLDVYERMGQRARQLAAEHQAAVRLGEQQLVDLAFATDDARDEADKRAKALTALKGKLRDAEPTLRKLADEAATAQQDAEKAAELVKRLGEVRVPADVKKLASKLRDHRSGLSDAQRTLKAAETEARKQAKALEGKPDHVALTGMLDAHEELENVQDELAKARDRLASGQDNQATAGDEEASTEKQRDKAREALTHLETEHHAHAVAETLVVGEPCPVCRQPVSIVPRRKVPADLDRARRTAQRAEREYERARERRTRCREAVAAAKRDVTATDGRRRTLHEKVAAHPDRDRLERLIASVTQAQQAAEDARTRRDKAQRNVERIRTALDRLDVQQRTARGRFREHRDPLVEINPPAPKEEDLEEDWDELVAWSAAQRPRYERRDRDAHATATRHREEHDRQLQALRKACNELNAIPPRISVESVSDLRALVTAAEQEAKAELQRIQKATRDSGRIRNQIETATKEAALADELGHLLRANRFERWLVAEALGLLVAGASRILRELSSGQYSLALDERNEFQVIDHQNADERRSAKTLSGGETFQASLALALALAQQLVDLAAHGTARLDAIFLDEGFGSLDDESLEVVAGTIESLASGARMVGVVTHIRDLAERIPVRYVVSKGARTSSLEKVVA